IVLAGVLLKAGGYGFLRFAVPLFPIGTQAWLPVLILLSVVAILYGAVVSVVQKDLKKLVAYSSVAHMGFVTLGIFVLNQQGGVGAVLQMLNHGFVTAAPFIFVGIQYEKTHRRHIADLGGLANGWPLYTACLAVFVPDPPPCSCAPGSCASSPSRRARSPGRRCSGSSRVRPRRRRSPSSDRRRSRHGPAGDRCDRDGVPRPRGGRGRRPRPGAAVASTPH